MFFMFKNALKMFENALLGLKQYWYKEEGCSCMNSYQWETKGKSK